MVGSFQRKSDGYLADKLAFLENGIDDDRSEKASAALSNAPAFGEKMFFLSGYFQCPSRKIGRPVLQCVARLGL